MRANEASKWRPIYRNVQLDEKCKINTLGRWWRARRGAGEEKGGGLGTERGVAKGGGGVGKSWGEEGGRSLSQAELAARS